MHGGGGLTCGPGGSGNSGLTRGPSGSSSSFRTRTIGGRGSGSSSFGALELLRRGSSSFGTKEPDPAVGRVKELDPAMAALREASPGGGRQRRAAMAATTHRWAWRAHGWACYRPIHGFFYLFFI